MADLAQVTEHIRGAVGDNSGLGKTVKLDLGDAGKIYIDGASTPNSVTNEDKPADTTVTGKVGIGAIPTGFGIEAELTIKAPGVPRDTLQALVDAAHIVCPYSNATRDNIDVSLVIGV